MDKKRLLITGGSGSIGRTFIERYYNSYLFYNISRNEFFQTELKREFPFVTNYIGSIEDIGFLYNVFEQVKPDIVLHTAAMKNIATGEENPIQLCKTNIIGSLNVIDASLRSDVSMTIGISTDKACLPGNNYGYTKSLMEKCFMMANTKRNKFAICRFANVAKSSSSVIPFWLKLKMERKALKLTDKRMNRLMFSKTDAVEFIHKTFELCSKLGGGFIGVNIKMKTVNMYDLAKSISNDIEVIGKISDAEKYDEDLVSEREVERTHILNDRYVMIMPDRKHWLNNMSCEFGSHNAEKMTAEEMRKLVEE